MNGIHAAFTGRIGKDAEVRTARNGKPWASFPAAVGDGDAPTWVRVALFGDAVGAVATGLTKGVEVYCEGRLSLGTWTGRDGEARSGLNLAAWTIQPMGQIGRRKRKARDEPESQGRDAFRRYTDERGAVPFDDELRF